MRFFLSLLVSGFFISAAILPVAAFAHEDDGAEDEALDRFLPAPAGTWSEGDYTVTLDMLADGKSQVRIAKSGAVVFEKRFDRVAFYEKSTPIQDLTGDGVPDLALATFTAANGHCCHAMTVFSLGDTFKDYGTYQGGDYEINLETRTYYRNTQPEGTSPHIYAMLVFDGYGEHWGAGLATVPVILAPKDGAYEIAPALMRQPRWHDLQIQKIAEDIRKLAPEKFTYHFTETPKADASPVEDAAPDASYLQAMLSKALMLIYRGNQDQAKELITLSWVGTEEERERFWKDLWQVIDTKPYGRDIRALNVTY